MPVFFSKASTLSCTPVDRRHCRRSPCDRRRRSSAPSATWRPKTFSSASEISPTVALARAARMANSSRLSSPCAARVSASSAVSTAATSRVPFSCCSLDKLARAHLGIVDLQHVDLDVRLGPEGVDADQRLLAGIDARLGAGGRLLDAQLRNAFLDRRRHAAERSRPPRYGPARAPRDHASAARR